MRRASKYKSTNQQRDQNIDRSDFVSRPFKNIALRSAIHAVLAASALSVAMPPRAQATCTDVSTTLFCSGNESGGIYTDDYRLGLVVTNLTAPIAPGSGTRGINFFRDDPPENPLVFYWDGSQSISTRFANSIHILNFIEPFLNGRAGDITATIAGGSIFTSGGDRYDSIFVESYGQESRTKILPTSGGNVTVNNSASIYNESFYGRGIYAHSWATYSGLGGNVHVTSNAPTIETTGDGSHGIFALSEGGYGANGSSGLDGSSGIPGGNGGDVIVQGSGNIFTSYFNSHGILAISRGGIGGSGGDGWIANAGNGVFGGKAGNVTVDGSWNIYTGLDNSSGIFAESLGGEGGQGGTGYTFGSGGSGGGSGDGGTVAVTSRGTINTGYGANSYGIFAHSVGGFAGGGGNSYGVVGYGGSGESAGFGGAVTVNNFGSITTYGDSSHGIYAQSVGGGGGSGGNSGGVVSVGGGGAAGGNGGDVLVTNAGAIIASGRIARGIFAQSVGGGGGDGGDSGGVVAIGGSGSGTSDGGSVTVINSGDITSSAHAIFAESIGGGGGNGGSSTGWFSVGGSGGSGGNSKAVSVENHGSLTTTEINASAIFAHSIGGGGGNGGASISAGLGASFAIGGNGATGGDGDVVTVHTDTGSIVTGADFANGNFGDNASGIFAQSVGGSGGNGGYAFSGAVSPGASLAIAMGGQGAGGGVGKHVEVTSDSSIATHGNDASAIFAESLGGGGGSGGFAIALSGGSLSGAFAIGGTGSGGGASDTVNVTSTGTDLQTFGDRSSGIVAQSVGGGGGSGGFAVAGVFNVAPSVSGAFALGGNGGGGGNAQAVTVESASNISTSGAEAHGLFVQSVGGGGGNGGFSVAASISGGAAVNASFGGVGGGGGAGGTVDVGINAFTTGTIHTRGDGADGLFAQSVGGGGGNGGFSVAGSISAAPSANLSVGGDGGTARNSDAVTVHTANTVITEGRDSHGVVAQSIGGGGGSGGFSVAGAISASGAVSAGIGGKGAGGGDAGTVTVENVGASINTSGDHSYGLFAQSVGGGGGDGGFAVAASVTEGPAANFAMGGDGGQAGAGREVKVTSTSAITTRGDDSNALFAQSVGGGGGSGGFSVAGSLSASGGTLGASIGGDGAGGGVAGRVTIITTATNTGAIATSGDRSIGILAQSIGGGGGNGGFAIGGSISNGPSASLSIGGNGGTGSDSNIVNVDSASSITTSGNDSHGIFAQSVGGGGGDGGFAVAGSISATGNVNAALGGRGDGGGNAADVILKSTGVSISTLGIHSYGIVAQSLGGGGGDGGFSVAAGISNGVTANLSMGGSGAGGGIGHDVTLTTSTIVTTQGDDSHGVFAQSVGGGGGSGGFAVTGGISRANAGASLGGSGAGGGDAGTVVLSNTASMIATAGDHAYGVIAQSIGGGGGDGGFSVTGGISSSGSASLALGGSGSGGGNGKAVTLTSSSNVFTEGNDSHGLFAQSVGGGGGSGGFAVAGAIANNGAATAALGGSGAGGGNADAVTLTNTGNVIDTFGDRSYGVVAQSVGGGGGDGGFSVSGSITKGPAANFSMGGSGAKGGVSSSVILNSTSDVATHGDDSHGIFAQSIGGGGGSGGFSVAGGISADSGTVSASIGGSGAAGGNSGTVSLGTTSAISGLVTTEGDRSYGILAQSIGGGGGDGGFSVAGGISKGDGAKFSMGGSGGTGSNSDVVTVQSAATIQTLGDESHGIFAQSVGGGGGSGGFSVAGSISTSGSSINASIGGSGAGGGDGKAVSVGSTGTSIETAGDRAYGIVAQSVGGGGGDGGFSVAGSIDKQKTVNFSLGGFGDVGGASGIVSVLSATDITTLGAESHAIFAQSLGGGGGSGGFSVAGSLFASTTNAPSIDASIGGFGAGGGNAGAVSVGAVDNFVTGVLDTSGAGAYGIFAQSLGGGGGNGGFSVSGGLNKSPAIRFALGGSAGTGSDADVVNVYTAANITTRGDDSHGVFAQSLGGGGGNGGFAISGSATTDTTSVNASIGGQGGGGGRGGDVGVQNAGSIVTVGNESIGVFAQSIGGGGGNGGFAISGSLTAPPSGAVTKKPADNIEFSMGGDGGTGDRGGIVSVLNSGVINTAGDGSHGILAQSVGGGGGSGGFAGSGTLSVLTTKSASKRATIATSLGGDGGNGNIGGDVDVTNTRDITTRGNDARGIYAYSLGGGGGNGGSSYAIDVALGKVQNNNGLNLELAVGGTGGTGNNSGVVTVDNDGSIITLGDRGDAIFAQSVGGGGGDGGKSQAASFDFTRATKPPPVDGADSWNVTASIGGNGGSANDGGQVSVTNSGNIETFGFYARGIVAQSIGGGGGSGANGIQGTGVDAIDTGTEILDLRDKDFLKNLFDLKAWSITVGGSGGASGDGKDVAITNSGSIITHGLDSFGIFAQSVGGGGGEAQNFAKGTGAGGTASSGINSKFALGGGGGASGNGGTITITNTNNIETFGDEAHAIFAQSVGGGGGVAGNVDRGFSSSTGPIPKLNIGVGFAVGQDGGGGGNGGDVTVTNAGSITTHGNGAFGIIAQSVGGGGGAAGGLGNSGTFAAPVLSLQNFYGSAGGAGDAGIVTVNQAGNITASGANAIGIFAQSATTNGVSKAVNITVNGDVTATGQGSFGILVQSLGAQTVDHTQSSGDINVTITSGSVRGGRGLLTSEAAAAVVSEQTENDMGAAIDIRDGKNNSLTNRGIVGDTSDLNRMAILGEAGNETINNFGTLVGNLNLGAGNNTLINQAHAKLISGATIDLASTGTLTNNGDWSVSNVGTVGVTTLNGNLIQNSGARLLVDFDHITGAADRINLTAGGTASLAGSVVLNELNSTSIKPGKQEAILVSASGGVTASNLSLIVAQSPITQYQLAPAHVDATTGKTTDLLLSAMTDFSGMQNGVALSRNGIALGQYINEVQQAGSSTALKPTIAHLLAITDGAHLSAAYEQLSPQRYAVNEVSGVNTSTQFSNAMLSCRQRDGEFHFVSEGQCGWFAVTTTQQHQNASVDVSSFSRDASTVAGGVQFALSSRWHLGFGASYTDDHVLADSILRGNNGQTSTSDISQIGLVVKGNFGLTTLALSATGGHEEIDATRQALLDTHAHSNQSVGHIAAQFRVAHAFDLNRWYWRPMLDIGVQQRSRNAFNETGAGANDLQVLGSNDNYVIAAPAIETGIDVPMTEGLARWYARIGVTRYLSGSTITTQATLEGAPAGVAPFEVREEMDKLLGDVSVGVDLFSVQGMVIRLNYSGQFSSHTAIHGGGIKLAIPF